MDFSDDINSRLLGALQGDDEMDPGSANALGMLQALQQYSEKAASGQKRSPFGQVADALQTMLAMKFYGQHIQQQMMKQRLDRELKLSLIRQRLESGQREREKTEREKKDAPLKTKLDEALLKERQATAALTQRKLDDPLSDLPAESREIADQLRSEGIIPTLGAIYQRKQADLAKRSREQAAVTSALIAGRQEDTDRRKREEDERKRLLKPLPGDKVYVDRTTGRQVPLRTIGDLEGGDYVPLSKMDADAVASARDAKRQLTKLRVLSDYLLPEYSPNILKGVTKTVGSAAWLNLKEQSGSPAVNSWDQLRDMSNMTMVRTLLKSGRILRDVLKNYPNVGRLDSKQSARHKIRNHEEMLDGQLMQMGIDPSIFDAELEGYKPSVQDVIDEEQGKGKGKVSSGARPNGLALEKVK